jgi:hypothetical protein
MRKIFSFLIDLITQAETKKILKHAFRGIRSMGLKDLKAARPEDYLARREVRLRWTIETMAMGWVCNGNLTGPGWSSTVAAGLYHRLNALVIRRMITTR